MCRHVIKTHSEPVRSKVRRSSPEMLEVAKKETGRLLEVKIIRRGTSSLGLPTHLMKKKQPGQNRLTEDFRALNAVTEHDSYPFAFISTTSQIHCMVVKYLVQLI